jgi:hypothetical protein
MQIVHFAPRFAETIEKGGDYNTNCFPNAPQNDEIGKAVPLTLHYAFADICS